ncbi:MAG: hypothetical protein ACK58T_23035, partial [Phycisphaerae bacterium]
DAFPPSIAIDANTASAVDRPGKRRHLSMLARNRFIMMSSLQSSDGIQTDDAQLMQSFRRRRVAQESDKQPLVQLSLSRHLTSYPCAEFRE